ncbi:alpha-crystallin B chain-like [Diorhabda carinulata]|uniref:alpha-crystallin B chain-like n=1 Tax=Diorhabda sublineata TaxID=1163346 RepID=UPI0024E11838|nr:alpha-crystallin B chain-like [Diorhabda sublineata]XP_057657938.1 alpha-crystallin B chain-like [Diorhabda carinulata]
MSNLPAIWKEFMKPLKLMETQMKAAEEFFRPKVLELMDLDKNEITHGKDKVEMKMRMPEFKPEEIVVKTVNGNSIEVEAKQVQTSDDKNRHTTAKYIRRRFILPFGTDIKNVSSTLSSDGTLTITAPRKMEDINEKLIPIVVEKRKDSLVKLKSGENN